MKNGDLLKIRGKTEWYAELVGRDDDDNKMLEVYYITRSKANKWVWEYEEEWQLVHENSVTEHIPLISNALESYKRLGFRPLTENTFIKLSDEIPNDVMLPMGEFEQEGAESDEDMSDFIVPDEEGEAFTFADPSIPFVQETHQLVHKFNTWEPKDDKEQKLKQYVGNLSQKYKTMDDERQFVDGKCLDYDRPSLNPTTNKK